jgi:hypothetical protein
MRWGPFRKRSRDVIVMPKPDPVQELLDTYFIRTGVAPETADDFTPFERCLYDALPRSERSVPFYAAVRAKRQRTK